MKLRIHFLYIDLIDETLYYEAGIAEGPSGGAIFIFDQRSGGSDRAFGKNIFDEEIIFGFPIVTRGGTGYDENHRRGQRFIGLDADLQLSACAVEIGKGIVYLGVRDRYGQQREAYYWEMAKEHSVRY
jgi:hypothetical protein